MTGSQLRKRLSRGLACFAIAATGSARAQTMPPGQAPGMPAGSTLAPVPADSRGPSLTVQPASPDAADRSAPGPAPTPAGCSCGHRHGVSRWWYHKTQCKRSLQDCALGYPEEFNEWPLGSSLYAHGRTQVANGNAARMVFYHYDFDEGSPQLNVRGRDKLARLAKVLPTSFSPVVIERSPETPGLDEGRRGTVLAGLADSPFPVPAERVVIGPAIAAGMAGYESILVYGNQLGALQAGGAAGVGGYAGSQGLSPGGLSSGTIAGFGTAGGFGR